LSNEANIKRAKISRYHRITDM